MTGAGERSFQEARGSVLLQVKRDLDAGIAKLTRTSRILVQDCLTFDIAHLDSSERLNEQQKADAAILRQGAEILLEAVGDHLRAALTALEQGRSVYQLLGAREIPTYKAITGGDASAGALSAVEDISVLLMSMDTKDMRTQLFEEIKRAGTLSPALVPTLARVLSYTATVAYDHILMGMTSSILEKIHSPRDIQYENGPMQAGPSFLKKLFKGMASIVHHTTRDTWRADKIAKAGNAWPPLKVQSDGTQASDEGPAGMSSVPAILGAAKEFLGLQTHDAMDYRTGYLEVMTGFFLTMQDRHFQALRSGTYAALSKLPAIHEKKIQEVALSAVSELRERLTARMAEVPSISGVFSQGALDAFDHAQFDIQTYDLPSSKREALNERIISRLRDEWCGALHSALKRVEQGGAVFRGVDEPYVQPA